MTDVPGSDFTVSATQVPEEMIPRMLENCRQVTAGMRFAAESILSMRGEIRKSLGDAIAPMDGLPGANAPLDRVCAIDGAYIVDSNRLCSYAAVATVKIGRDCPPRCDAFTASLPNITDLAAVAGGLMTIQEMIAAVEAVETDPGQVVLIDGTRVSAIIRLNQLYSTLFDEWDEYLERVRGGWGSEAMARLLRRFEERDWVTPYMTHPRIVGSAKLVSTGYLAKAVGKRDLRVDDKILAMAVLEDGEFIRPMGLRRVSPGDRAPFMRMTTDFPWREAVRGLAEKIMDEDAPEGLHYVYYRINEAHGVAKAEVSKGFLDDGRLGLGRLLSWWKSETDVVDVMEPLMQHVADRAVKTGVQQAYRALQAMVSQEFALGNHPEFGLKRRS